MKACNREVRNSIPDCIFVVDVTLDNRLEFVRLNPAEEKAVPVKQRGFKVARHYRACLVRGTLVAYHDELDLRCLIPLRNTASRIHRIVRHCVVRLQKLSGFNPRRSPESVKCFPC